MFSAAPLHTARARMERQRRRSHHLDLRRSRVDALTSGHAKILCLR
jgi:hypothetical protein